LAEENLGRNAETGAAFTPFERLFAATESINDLYAVDFSIATLF
jgi:hypothetical protein